MAEFIVVLNVPDDLLEGEAGFDDLTAIKIAHRYLHAMGSGQAPFLRAIGDDNG